MRKSIYFLLVLLVLSTSKSFGEEKRVYLCHRLTREPILDGKIRSDPAWEGIQPATDFIKLGSESLASKQTSFKIGYTAESLFIGVECEEPEIGKIKAKAKDSDVAICSDDSVEIFIVSRDTNEYYQFVINAIGSRWSYEYAAVLTRGPEIPLTAWQAKTYQGKDYWSAEIKIPFEILLAIPEKEGKWNGNICRNIYTSSEDKYTSWEHLIGGFHQSANLLGSIVFKDEILAKEVGRKTKRKILSLLKEKTVSNLQELSDVRKEASERLGKSSSLQGEIVFFLKRCREIEEQVSKVSSVKEANLLIKESQKLLIQEEKLMRKIILENFFDE
jgi:hypothetical protein